MPAPRCAAACLVVACTLTPFVASPEASASPSPLVDRINDTRAAHGIRALRYSPNLARSSARFARYLIRNDRFAHAARIIASNRFSRLGEILALTRGWKIDRTRTIANWVRSPSHLGVLLSSSFRYVGAARVRGRFGRGRAVVWTVQFGG